MKNTLGLLVWLASGLAVATAAVVGCAPCWLTLAALSKLRCASAQPQEESL